MLSMVTSQAVDFLYRILTRVATSTTLMPIAMVFVMWGRITPTLLLDWCVAIIGITLVQVLLSIGPYTTQCNNKVMHT